jgi:hypothetical protein
MFLFSSSFFVILIFFAFAFFPFRFFFRSRPTFLVSPAVSLNFLSCGSVAVCYRDAKSTCVQRVAESF